LAVESIHAYTVGEHGDSAAPLGSGASIGLIPVPKWSEPPIDEATRASIAEQVVRLAELIIRGKGATNYVIGLWTARIVEAVLHDEGRVLPVSSLLDGQCGSTDVCLSLPNRRPRRRPERAHPAHHRRGDRRAAGLRRGRSRRGPIPRPLV
jgi:L-lactate dehydrogenase